MKVTETRVAELDEDDIRKAVAYWLREVEEFNVSLDSVEIDWTDMSATVTET